MNSEGTVFQDLKRVYRSERCMRFKEDDGNRNFSFSDEIRLKLEVTQINHRATEEAIDELLDEMVYRVKEIIAADQPPR